MAALMAWDKGLFEQFVGITLFLCPYIQIYYIFSTKVKLAFLRLDGYYAPFSIWYTFGWFVFSALTFLILFCLYGIIALIRLLRKGFHFSLCKIYRWFNKRYELEEACPIFLEQIDPYEGTEPLKKIFEVVELESLIKLDCGHRFHFVCLAL